MRKYGFTLAEVLIVVLIIGIIAVITIPVLISNWHEHSWDVARKKMIANLSQVTTFMNLNNELSGYDTTEEFMDKFSKYMKSTQVCNNDALGNCFSPRVKESDSNKLIKIDEWKTSKDMDEVFESNIVGMKLTDGQELLVSYNPACPVPAPVDTASSVSMCLSIMYDVNGNKKPNTLGKDVFKLNAGDIEDYIAQHPLPSVPDSTPSDGITDGSDGNGGTSGGTDSGSTGDGDTTGGDGSDTTLPTEPTYPEGGTSGGDSGNTGGTDSGSAGGGYEDCLINPDLIGSMCITKIIGPDTGYSPMTRAECEAARANGEIDVKYCNNINNSDESYAAAVKACGGKKANLPNEQPLFALAKYVYNTDAINGGTKTTSGLTLDKEKAAPFLAQSQYGNDASDPRFYVWSDGIDSGSAAPYRDFYSDNTHYGSTFRTYIDLLAICVN